jgi:hypothetical protein
MREELDNALCVKYPKIFAQRNLPMNETAMCWGFCCGDGWYDILNSLCSQIQHHIDWKQEQKEKYNRGEGCVQVVAVQVKEKFGGLRFYYDGGDDVIDGMVRMAESWASRTCETCGEKGEHRVSGGWHYVACDKHARKENDDDLSE